MGTLSIEYRQQLELLRTAFEELAHLALDEPIVATVVMMPPEHRCSKQSGNHYNIKPLEPHSDKVRRQQPESLLEITPNDTLPLPQNIPDFSPLQATSTLPDSPLQTCFSSQHACESGTNNCTDHGICSLKFSIKTGENTTNNCYGCVCSSKVTKNPDGSKKTTYYGGGACQKKDIVAPFWLLAGTTVFFISLISFVIGLLYSMGNDELPSVIGAGVSGPRPK
jgi:hypothetical protein